MRIRRYEIADWRDVCSIYDLSKPDELKSERNPPIITSLDADTKMKALFHKSDILVAEQSNHVVGFTGTRANHISWLFVHPLYRRTRVAENLLQKAMLGLHGAVELNVAKSNKAAVSLYEKLGFVVQREFTGSFNGHEVQVLRLHKVLA
jgi:ribosomal protein S18 acetylase RimI-like enzyme